MSRPDLIVVGDVMLDVVVAAGALAGGGDVLGQVRIRPGGSGANAAAWAAHDGAQVRLYGSVGTDLAGRLLGEMLRERGVDARLTRTPDVGTGTMLVVRQPGDRSMVADRGANATLLPDHLPAELEGGAILVSGYLLFHPGSAPVAVAALSRARSSLVAVDASSWPLAEAYGPRRFLDATRLANVLLANDREVDALFGPGGPTATSARYEHVVTKRGAAGAEHLHVPTGRRTATSGEGAVEAIDPSGAGDAFDGVFLAALARGASLEEALSRGCQAGAAAAASLDTWPPR